MAEQKNKPIIKAKLAGSLLDHTGSVYAVQEGFSSKQLITGSGDRQVILWDLKHFRKTNWRVDVGSPIYSLHHVPEANALLIGTMSGHIHIIDLEAKKEIKNLKHHEGSIFDIKHSPKTGQIFTASADGTVSIISMDELKFVKSFKLCDKKVRDIDINEHAGEIAIGCGDGTARIWDLETLEEKQILNPERASVNAVRFHPDGQHLITGEKDAYLHIWSKANGLYELVEAIPAHNYAIYSIDFSPNGKYFATASRDKTVKIWDAKRFKMLLRIERYKHDGHVNSVNKLAWCKYNDYLATASDDRSVLLWEIYNIRN